MILSETDTTYRLVDLNNPNNVGRTAATPELAKLVPGDLNREGRRLGIERTDWVEHNGKPKISRTVLIEVEGVPGEWVIGVDKPRTG
jgi:hypothetical protein